MELRQAAHRILRGHWVLILGALLIGVAIAIPVAGGAKTYSASARISLGKKVPQVDSEAAALASTARGIATSPTIVPQALRASPLRRNSVQLHQDDVTVSSPGTRTLPELT